MKEYVTLRRIIVKDVPVGGMSKREERAYTILVVVLSVLTLALVGVGVWFIWLA